MSGFRNGSCGAPNQPAVRRATAHTGSQAHSKTQHGGRSPERNKCPTLPPGVTHSEAFPCLSMEPVSHDGFLSERVAFAKSRQACQLSPMSRALTDGILVTVETRYLPERSTPAQGRYGFAYEVTITNHGETAAQLLRRHWIITDAMGEVQEVRGDGVIGEQPRLDPGDTFEYQSWCLLPTPLAPCAVLSRCSVQTGRPSTPRSPLSSWAARWGELKRHIDGCH